MRAIRTRQLFQNNLLTSTGVYGANGVAAWIRDAVQGTNSIDCLWIGDSNTGFNGWGWADGWQHGLCQNGAPMYGSMIWVPWNSQANLGYRSNVFSSFSQNTGTGVVAGTGGTSGASAALKATFGVGTGSLTIQGTAGTAPDFVDVPGARSSQSETALWLFMRNIQTGSAAAIEATYAEPMPIGFNEALVFRAQVNLRSGGTAKFTSRFANLSNGGLGALGNPTQSTTTVSASTDSWDTYTHTLAADSTRFVYPPTNSAGQFGVKVAIDGSGVGLANAVAQGTSVGLCSVYRAINGTASSIMEYRGSATLTQLATDINQAKSGFCTTLLKEARQRQIAAGGSGRVLICIQGGVNSGDWSPSNPAAAITAVESIKTDIKSAWATLGYPAADLLFLFMVSHPIDAGDASLTVLRTYAQNYYASSSDTLFVNLNDIAPFTTITANNWFDNLGNAHLDEITRGYEAISSRIVSNILRYSP